ncbi:MAG: glycosyltransferase family 2 protein [Gallionella sp.]|jgi:glycosyltransferase involved in cell wall biosynthesis|nr:glycosyltransferase family 2 protein [Gallionella sp.]
MKKVNLELNSASTAPVVINDTSSLKPTAQRVVIAMATYNGGRFIEEQIQSIQAQSYSDWVLYVRDDGSRDDTVQKVLQIEREDHRVKLVRDELGNQGPIGNFSTLMEFALERNADYVFFADQDDVWHAEKIATMLAGMQELELTHDVQTPLLVHCDLAVVNEVLQPIAKSFVQFSRLSPTTADLGVLLCQNQVTGCACVINRALLELACPVPRDVLMHDWWLALLASSAGKIGFIPKPLVQYRQHGGNVLGAMSFGRRVKKLLFSPLQWKLHMEVIKCSFAQAAMIEERINARGIELSPITMEQINIYSRILNVAPLRRAGKLHAHKMGRSANSTGFVFDLLITLMRRKQEVKSVA